MSAQTEYRVAFEQLPELYPTSYHEPAFWEMLGRTVGTFGFLEFVLGRAIFAFTGIKEYSEPEIQEELEKWIPKLEKALSDTLVRLIKAYESSVKSHKGAQPEGFVELIRDLKDAAELRNVLCHGFWGKPDQNGSTIPFFVKAAGMEIFEGPVDIAFLRQTQLATSQLAVAVINTVTSMGYQFPGSSGPGRPIY